MASLKVVYEQVRFLNGIIERKWNCCTTRESCVRTTALLSTEMVQTRAKTISLSRGGALGYWKRPKPDSLFGCTLLKAFNIKKELKFWQLLPTKHCKGAA